MGLTPDLSAWFLALFLTSLGLSWGWFKLRRAVRRVPVPRDGCVVRIRTADGLYRARFLGAEKEGLRLSAPLSRGHYAPIRVGERLVIEGTSARGALLFDCDVLERRAEPCELLVSMPSDVRVSERRMSPRQAFEPPEPAQLDGSRAELLDLSAFGARVRKKPAPAKGQRVLLSEATRVGSVAGWVLDSEPISGEARLRFEEPIEVGP